MLACSLSHCQEKPAQSSRIRIRMPAHDLSALRIRRDEKPDRPRAARRVLVWIVVAALIAAAGWYLLGGRVPRAAPEVRLERPRRIQAAGAVESLTATGYIVPQRRAAVSARMFGRLEWLGVDEGDRVTSGTVIARLAADDLEAQVAEARAAIAQARATLQQARAAEWEARREEERYANLLAEGISTASDHDASRRALDVAAAGVTAAEEAIRAAQARLDLTRANLDKTVVRAPFDGVVIAKNAEVGEMVAATTASGQVTGGAIVTIADFSTLEMEADINESNLPRVRTGQPALVSVDAVPGHRYRGVLRQIVPAADRQKAVVTAKVALTDLDDRLVPDMSARVVFLEKEVSAEEAARPPQLFVPAAAIRADEGGHSVFVAREDRVARVPVTLGESRGDLREILSGLRGDEALVISGEPLREGDRIRVAP